MLAFAQPIEQHDLPVGKLKRIVMCVWIVHVDLPEPSHLFQELCSRTLKGTSAANCRIHIKLRWQSYDSVRHVIVRERRKFLPPDLCSFAAEVGTKRTTLPNPRGSTLVARTLAAAIPFLTR